MLGRPETEMQDMAENTRPKYTAEEISRQRRFRDLGFLPLVRTYVFQEVRACVRAWIGCGVVFDFVRIL